MANIQPPKNRVIEAVKAVLDKLIEGVGVEVAVTAGQAELPILAAPIIRTLFRWGVEKLADVVNAELFHWGVKIVLRVQGSAIKKEFNDALKPIMVGSPTLEEIERARKAAIDLINRNRP